MNRFSEKDWKIFRNKFSGWQEAYMDKLNKEYIALLSGEGNASDKFWKLEKRIREDKKDCGVQCAMSRLQRLWRNLKQTRIPIMRTMEMIIIPVKVLL